MISQGWAEEETWGSKGPSREPSHYFSRALRQRTSKIKALPVSRLFYYISFPVMGMVSAKDSWKQGGICLLLRGFWEQLSGRSSSGAPGLTPAPHVTPDGAPSDQGSSPGLGAQGWEARAGQQDLTKALPSVTEPGVHAFPCGFGNKDGTEPLPLSACGRLLTTV